MRAFLNYIKSETLNEIKTSLENLWQRMIQLSEFFQYSFVLLLKRKCLVELTESAWGRVVLLQLLSIHGGAVGVTDLGVMLLWSGIVARLITATTAFFGSGHSGYADRIHVRTPIPMQTNTLGTSRCTDRYIRHMQTSAPKMRGSSRDTLVATSGLNRYHFLIISRKFSRILSTSSSTVTSPLTVTLSSCRSNSKFTTGRPSSYGNVGELPSSSRSPISCGWLQDGLGILDHEKSILSKTEWVIVNAATQWSTNRLLC